MVTNLKPFLLLILDGWGYREDPTDNAIAAANTPTWDYLWQHCPHMVLSGSGNCVGLPEGQMGNSEVGHLNIGSGRVVYQEFTRIEHAIQDGQFFENPTLIHAINQAIQTNKKIHLLGLLSPGGVHSHENQIFALLELTKKLNAQNVFLHAFLDGRDTAPKSADISIAKAEEKMQQLGVGRFASLIGRYFAMDRDKRWDRVQKAYDLLTLGKAEFHATSALAGLKAAYARGTTDEFVPATTIVQDNTLPITIDDGDVVIFMNYRADRARELTHAFLDPEFEGFQRTKQPKLAHFLSLTEYAKNLPTEIIFKPEKPKEGLGEYISQLGYKQLRVAETEKYAHVTFFFNGGIEPPFPGEDRILVPSAKVATYDLKPEMSAVEITDALVEGILSRKYLFIVCNFANPDMVGHTGNFDATVKAIETIDHCLSRIYAALKEVDGQALITADHGNAEIMYDHSIKQPNTAHTHEPVPLVYIGNHPAKMIAKNGVLADIAPTILYCLALPKPKEMTGQCLLHFTE